MGIFTENAACNLRGDIVFFTLFVIVLTLSEFHVKQNTKVTFSVPMLARIMKPCIVIVLDIRPGVNFFEM